MNTYTSDVTRWDWRNCRWENPHLAATDTWEEGNPDEPETVACCVQMANFEQKDRGWTTVHLLNSTVHEKHLQPPLRCCWRCCVWGHTPRHCQFNTVSWPKQRWCKVPPLFPGMTIKEEKVHCQKTIVHPHFSHSHTSSHSLTASTKTTLLAACPPILCASVWLIQITPS